MGVRDDVRPEPAPHARTRHALCPFSAPYSEQRETNHVSRGSACHRCMREGSMETSLETGAGTRVGNGSAIGTALGNEVRPRSEVTQPYQRMADEDRGTGGESLADFLGYFSIGLGLAELVAPTLMSRLIGVKHPDDRTRSTMRLMGVREIGHGISILSKQQPAEALWGRVAGDALDLA